TRSTSRCRSRRSSSVCWLGKNKVQSSKPSAPHPWPHKVAWATKQPSVDDVTMVWTDCQDPETSRTVMRYPIVIEEGTSTTAFGVVVPDLPGCFSAGDTLDEALEAAKEAAAAWIDAALDQGMPVPQPSTLESVRNLRGYRGWTVGIIDLEQAFFDDTIERVNITLPRRVLRRLDDMARNTGQSRSGLIARL